MIVIDDFNEFVEAHKEIGGRVLEVTQKVYYVLEPYETRPLEKIKKEWFEEFVQRGHVYKDNSKISSKTNIVEVKEL